MFDKKTILITGGTGSFGKTLAYKFLNTAVKQIRIFSRDEKKQDDLRIKLSNDKVKFYLGDVRDVSSIKAAIKDVDYVFHAAALKQVPSCEFHPMEAIKTNVIGTENVIDEAIMSGVKKLVLLSTDKAVYPINAMGMSKALAEKVLIAKSRSLIENETILCATRYGNVMASRGSVIPLFTNQILNNKPLTVTDPNMTRFLMTLSESVDLVLHAFENGEQGDIFVQKSPAATVLDLAMSLKEIFNSVSEIKLIGTRHGEKLYESLVSREEMLKAISSERFFRLPMDNRSLDYSKYFEEGQIKIKNTTDYNSHNATRLNLTQISSKLIDLQYIKDRLNG
tara:strand:+ start:15270 stop:16280 length:1011 start_codon:yes stop_codon:yes gene_type:complete